MNIKKIFKSILFIFIMFLGTIGNSIKVNAAATSGDIIGGEYINGYYTIHEKSNGSRMWSTARFIIRSSDGAFVYCVQPFVTIKNNNTYSVTTEDLAAVANISQENWDIISRIAYYGYGYKDDTHNHSSNVYYAAAQMLIWQYADTSIKSYFTDTLKGTRNDNILKSEQNEIMDLVNSHYVAPKFNNIPSEIVVGNSITITDSNNVLSRYNLTNVKNATITKNGNSLTITATDVGDISFNLSKANNKYGEQVRLYYATDSQNVVRRGDLDPILSSFKIKVIGGKVTVNKTDSDTSEQIPQGEASLEGAVYGVYEEDGTKVGTVTTDKNGNATSDYLPSLGRFYLQEEKASTGYKLDSNKYYFDITSENLYPEVQVFEEVIKRTFEFTKVYANSKTGIMTPEVGVQFGIYNNKNELVSLSTTDEQGNFNVTLPYGKYTVKQLTNTTGYEKNADFLIEVNETGKTIKQVIANAEITAKLKVIKVDKETGNVIARSGIKFKIKDTKTGEYVKQQVTYPKVVTYDTYETDENGILITPYPLNSGTYILEEVDQAIDGYLWNKESVEFTIDENANLISDNELGVLFEVKFENKRVKGSIEIKKQGEEFIINDGTYTYNTDEVLEGIKYCIYQNDKEVKCGTTNETGKLVFNNLELGKYTLKEISTLDNYILDTKEYEIELKYKDQYTPVITYQTTLTNYLKKGTLEFSKTDLTTSEGIPNTKVEIYTENDELIYTGLTDDKGKIAIDELPIGKYYIVETEAATGYKLSNEKVYFEIKDNGEIVKANMTNEKITGTLDFTKLDFSTSEPLPNTTIEIYNDKDELIGSYITNEEGKVVIEKLEYGKYYIIEKNAPEGYQLNPNKMYFEILEDGEVVKSVMTDEQVIVEVPNTDASDYAYLIGLILIILGIGTTSTLLLIKKKNKNEK